MPELILADCDCFANNKKLRELAEDRLVIYSANAIEISQSEDALVVTVNGSVVAEFHCSLIRVSMTIRNKS